MVRQLIALSIFASLCSGVIPATKVFGDCFPVRLKCEYVENPVGIDAAKPRFSWEVESHRRGERQTAYQILVASSREKLDKNQADKWDSGKIASSDSVNIAYEGTPLKSRETCYWKVRLWS